MDGLLPEVVRGVFTVEILGSAGRGGWGRMGADGANMFFTIF